MLASHRDRGDGLASTARRYLPRWLSASPLSATLMASISAASRALGLPFRVADAVGHVAQLPGDLLGYLADGSPGVVHGGQRRRQQAVVLALSSQADSSGTESGVGDAVLIEGPLVDPRRDDPDLRGRLDCTQVGERFIE